MRTKLLWCPACKHLFSPGLARYGQTKCQACGTEGVTPTPALMASIKKEEPVWQSVKQ